MVRLLMMAQNNKKKNNGVNQLLTLTSTSIPYSLYPIYAKPPVIEKGERPTYTLDISHLIPRYVRKDLENYGINLDLPQAQVFIKFNRSKNLYEYNLVEPMLTEHSFNAYTTLLSEIERNLLSKSNYVELGKILTELGENDPELNVFIDDDMTELSKPYKKAMYYITRNLFGYNILTPLLLDTKLEDISINGINEPVYVYHQSYEYIPTNIIFEKRIELFDRKIEGDKLLDELVLRFISLTNKTISIANPIMDGILPSGDRIAATFRREVSTKGSSLVIRRFTESPITILDLINSNVLSSEVAAYLWYALDLRMPFMVIGVTGAGKTTLLGSLLNLVKESWKITTIEDIPELNIAQDNWVQLSARPVYGEMGKEVSLMDLLKLSLRYRPDMIVVGEIRGQEAYVLFQAISTGHGGATTFHAHDSKSAIARLINEPLNIPREWIPMMNLIINVRRIPLPVKGKIELRRRVFSIEEVVSVDDLRKTVRWDPADDRYITDYGSMEVLKQRAIEIGLTFDDVKYELERRTEFLKLLASSKQITNSKESYRLVKKYVIMYSGDPEGALKTVKKLNDNVMPKK